MSPNRWSMLVFFWLVGDVVCAQSSYQFQQSGLDFFAGFISILNKLLMSESFTFLKRIVDMYCTVLNRKCLPCSFLFHPFLPITVEYLSYLTQDFGIWILECPVQDVSDLIQIIYSSIKVESDRKGSEGGRGV